MSTRTRRRSTLRRPGPCLESRPRLLSQIPTPSGHGWIAETEDPLLELYLLVGVPSGEVAQGATPSVRLTLVGELCVYSAPLVKPDLIGAASADGLLVLDLSDVTFCDAAGIGLLVSVRNELERRHIGLVIERVSRPVSHLLTMTGVAEPVSRAETSVSRPSTSVARGRPRRRWRVWYRGRIDTAPGLDVGIATGRGDRADDRLIGRGG